MSAARKSGRFAFVAELVICTLLVGAVALNALRRMDYLGSQTSQHIRMTDESRSAYIAKNIADGDGYVTNDLPAALVDFYDTHGKLHDKFWVNADRFPFAAYATSVLYRITGSTSWKVGILAYNLLTFVAFLVVLYAFSRAIWRDRYAALAAVTLALIHAYTFQFLYWKDGDMLLMTTLLMWSLYRYFDKPDALTWRSSAILGTLLAFVFLSRPNLGAAFILFFIVVTARKIWRARGEGLSVVAKRLATRELLVLAIGFVWCVPFMVHSLREWGSPLFSANNLYQLPLGTRFGMGTDTWWKYTEPGHPVTLGRLLHEAPGELASKFTSSWAATVKTVVGSYFVELLLACGLFVSLRRAAGDAPDEARPFRITAALIAFALVANVLLLPLYGYQDYSYRHYLGFGLPLLWLAAGRGVSLLSDRARSVVRPIVEHVSERRVLYCLLGLLALVAWNLGAPSAPDANRLFTRTTRFVEAHWLVIALALLAVFARRWLWRPPWHPRIVVLCCAFVFISFRPNFEMKRANFIWFPFDDRVWDALRARHGLVSSFALQGEVAWNTGRRNIPAPEWPMHIYSFAIDHDLDVEDVYIESADAQVSTLDGPFSQAGAGFEGYARLQHYRNLPGYEVAFHAEGIRSYPKFRIGPHPKASTVFHLVDPAAVRAMARGPEHLELGDSTAVIYTAHGWGDYYELAGKHVLAATEITRTRYLGSPGPWEDAGITFFLDDRRPKSFDLDFYSPTSATLTFYMNLDLFEWDRSEDRAKHTLGSLSVTPGWQHAHFEIPADLTRKGLNKIGFRTSQFQSTVMCPAAMSDDACRAEVPSLRKVDEGFSGATIVLRPDGQSSPQVIWISILASAFDLHY